MREGATAGSPRVPLPYHTASRPPAPARGGSHDFGESHLDVSHRTRLSEDHQLVQAVTRWSRNRSGVTVPLVYRRQPGLRLTCDFARRHIRHSSHKEPTGGGQTGRHQSDTIDGEVEHRRRGQDSAARDGDGGGCCARRLRLGLRSLGPVGPAVGASRLRAPLSPTASSSGLRSHRSPVAHCSRARGPCR